MKSKKKLKRRHDIYLSDEGNYKSLIVWSGKKDIPVKMLEIIEETLKQNKNKK